MLPPEHRAQRLSEAEESEVLQNPLESMMRALGVLRDRWAVLLIFTVLAGIGGLVLVGAMTPIWRATVTLVVNPTGLQVLDGVQGVHDDDANRGRDYLRHAATQREIIRSRRISETSLARLGLEDDPTFLGIDDIDDPAARERAREGIDPVDQLASYVRVIDVGDSRIMKIAVEYPDPETARDIANVVSESYLAYISSSRRETGEGAAVTVAEERELARVDLERKEARLDTFKQDHRITSISLADRQNLIAQNITTLSEKTKRAEAERYAAESTYAEASRLLADGAWSTAPFVDADQRKVFDELVQRRESALQELVEYESRYGEKHPKIVDTRGRVELLDERLSAISDAMLGGLRAKRDAAQQTEQKLRASLARENERALELGGLEPEYRSLEREATTAAETYAILARRDAELGLTNRVEKDGNPPVELLDRATVTRDPVRPQKPLLIGAALLLGLALGCVVALSLDLRDHRIRGTSDLKRVLEAAQLQMLGHLPSIEANPEFAVGNVRAQKRFRDLYTHFRPQSHIAERCRAIRTSISFNLGSRECPTLLVTSPSSGEGKSSLAVNLAASFSQANKSVLLLGADMRRPRLQQLFPPDQALETVGLSTVLSGESRVHEVIRSGLRDAPRHISVLTCGPIPENPAELIESVKFREMLTELRQRFDVIIIDSPPVLPVVDPVILSTIVDAVIVVARCRSTTRDQLRVALSELRQVDTNLLGVVLNDLSDANRGDGYAYAQSYYRNDDATVVGETPSVG